MIAVTTMIMIVMDGPAFLLHCFNHAGMDGETGCPNDIIETHFTSPCYTGTVDSEFAIQREQVSRPIC